MGKIRRQASGHSLSIIKMPDRTLMINVVLFCLRDDSLQVLLDSQAPTWELPGEPVEANESLEDAAARLLAKLIDRRETYLEQLYTYGSPQRLAVSVIYFALVPAKAHLLPGRTVRWFPVAQLPGLIGDHPEILTYALRRLRYKLEYSAVGFQLLPAEFSLSELQHTYEIVLDEKLDKRNFRRRMLHSGIIEMTPRLRTGEGRPARLYRYRPDAVAEVKARRLFP
jgi:8-oxo-dGTP diphosphatase